ncbi:hypothetical protein [Citrobacter phage Ci1]|nr:hypothetical protein [Citrobacter phage Ci1]
MISDVIYVVYVDKALTDFLRSKNVQIDVVEPDVDETGSWTGCMKVDISGRAFEIENVKQYVQQVNQSQGL